MPKSLALRKMQVNSVARYTLFSEMQSNQCMRDIDEIRRTNLLALEKLEGGTSAVAKRVGMSDSQFANLRDGAKDSRTGKPRGMRKETAWRFEDAFNKPRGWLDQDHSESLSSLPAQDQEFMAAVQSGLAEHEIPEHIRQTILTLIASSPEKK